MGIFGQSSPFDGDVEKATSETNTNDNWSLILDVCDTVTTNPRLAKDCLKAVMKRMGHADPHVVMQAITLLDALANNCGKPFHLEVASREFETEFRRLLGKSQPKVSLKMRQVLKNWAENDFKNDPELNLIPSLYSKLRIEGYDFSNLNEKTGKSAAAKAASLPKDPNVVSSQQEEDDIAKAIELSLKETKNSSNSPKQLQQRGGPSLSSSNNTSAYPSLSSMFNRSNRGFCGNGALPPECTFGDEPAGAAAPAAAAPEPRKVRALYDFEAAEENELTFFSGEIIHVLDDSDPNWWKGFNQRGEGLFPSNFVTADLSVDPERLDINQQHKSAAAAQKDEEEAAALALQQKTEAAAAAAANQPVEIDEAKIDRLLHLLHEANPEDPSQDSEEMLRLEQQVHQMGPLIDAELERVDRKHAQLTQLSSDLVDAINLYHSLMRDDRVAAGQFGGASVAGFMPGMSGFPGAALYGAAGYPSGAGFAPQNYPGRHSLPYGAGPGVVTTTAAQAVYSPQQQQQQQQQQQIPMPYQNGHGQQMNSLPPHLTQPSPAQQQMFNSTPPVTTAAAPPLQSTYPQAQQPPPPQQHQQQQAPQQYPGMAPPPGPAPPQQHHYMSPQHQQQPQQQPPQVYMPQQTQAPPGQLYGTPNGPLPPTTQNQYMLPPQPPQQQQQPQQPQQQPPPPTNHSDQFSQLQQQMAAMSMAQQMGVGVGVGVVGAPPPSALNQQSFIMQQNDAVKNNIPIYQQQR